MCVCVFMRNRNDPMFRILLKNANNQKNIPVNTKRVKSRSHTFQAMNSQVQPLLHCQEKSPASSFIILGWEVP